MKPETSICSIWARRRLAFTLIELLAVIAIVGVLAAFVFVALGRMRQSAHSAEGMSNLRQIGVAINLYTAEHRYILPGSQGNWLFWYDAISPYLQRESSNINRGATSMVLDSPAKAIPTNGPSCAFIANVVVMRDLAVTGNTSGPVWPAAIPRPSQTILVMDGEQDANGKVQHVNYQMPGITDTNSAHGNDSIGVLDNQDLGRANIRFRHRDNHFVQCLFADGHVDELENGKVLKKYFQIGY